MMTTRNNRCGITLIELLVAVFIMSILGLAMAQLMSSGMYTWRSGEMRRGAYEQGQFIFGRLTRDLATLYPHNPPMPGRWVFQADSLFSEGHDGTGNDRVTCLQGNLSEGQDGDAKYLRPTDPNINAWVEYEFETPFSNVATAVIQPKITLTRSPGCRDADDVTCRLVIQAAEHSVDLSLVDLDDHRADTEFVSGSHNHTITPVIDISNLVSESHIKVRLTIKPENGHESDIRLFQAAADDPVRPIFRFAASPHVCETGIGLVSGYRSRVAGTDQINEQYLVFVRADDGLKEVAYYVRDRALYRAERSAVGGTGSLFNAEFPVASNGTKVSRLAEGIIYFGCDFQNQYETGGGDEREKQLAAMQLHWNEADSVPPYVRAVVATVPLSGAKSAARLTAGLLPDQTQIRLDSTRPFVLGSAYRQFVKIDREWISYSGFDKVKLTGCARGQRGTLATTHDKGAEVIAGETFYVDIPIPAHGYRNR